MERENVPLQAYKTKELAAMYNISPNTFRKWIKPLRKLIGKRIGQFFNVDQVFTIFQSKGWPKVTSRK